MGWAEEKRKILIRPLHRRYAAEPPRRGSREMRRLNYWYQKTSYAPHQSLSATASPQGEALIRQ